MPQLNYQNGPNVARAGQISDQRPRTVLGRVSKTNVPYGFLVVYDSTIPGNGIIPGSGGGNPTADGCKLPAASGDITGNSVLGVVVETLAIESIPRVSFKGAVQVLSSPNVPASGVVQINFNGQQTANINWNDNAATIQARLTALSNVGAGNATVVGAFNAGPVIITFQGNLAGNPLSLVTVPQSANTMVDGSSNPVVIQVNEQIPYADLPIYPAGHEINVLEKGACWVTVEQDVTPASAVFVRYAVDNTNFPQSGPGAFRADSDSGTAAQLANARYMTTAVAGGLVLLEIDAI